MSSLRSTTRTILATTWLVIIDSFPHEQGSSSMKGIRFLVEDNRWQEPWQETRAQHHNHTDNQGPNTTCLSSNSTLVLLNNNRTILPWEGSHRWPGPSDHHQEAMNVTLVMAAF